MKIVLGSQSLVRKKILEKMGYEFEVLSANIDEKAIRFDDPVQLTLALARAKADAIIPRLDKDVILITSDQVVVCSGMILEKPINREEAKYFISLHVKHYSETVTSVLVTSLRTGKRFEGVDVARIHFGCIPEDVADKYIATGDPFLHSGGFDHEHPLIKPFVQMIDGEPESISGLPKTLTSALIKKAREEEI